MYTLDPWHTKASFIQSPALSTCSPTQIPAAPPYAPRTWPLTKKGRFPGLPPAATTVTMTTRGHRHTGRRSCACHTTSLVAPDTMSHHIYSIVHIKPSNQDECGTFDPYCLKLIWIFFCFIFSMHVDLQTMAIGRR